MSVFTQNQINWGRARFYPHRHQKLWARLIRSMQKELGLTQLELSRLMGVHRITIDRWERMNGARPREFQWPRIRELWGWVRKMRNKELDAGFWRDRVERPNFKD